MHPFTCSRLGGKFLILFHVIHPTDSCSPFKMAKRAREDSEYRRSLDTLFNLVQKWLKTTGDVAAAAAQSTSLESFITDPTPEKHLIHAIRHMNKLAQNIAGGKSLDDLYSALRRCVLDIRNDANLHQWVEDYIAYARRALENIGDNDIEEIRDTRQSLRQRWNELTDTGSDKSQNWKEDFEALREQVREFQERMETDKDLQAVRKAYTQLGRDIEDTLVDVAAVGLQAALGGTSWLWTDLFNVYLPRFVRMMKSIPIPRYDLLPSLAFSSISSLMYVIVRSTSTRKLNLCSKTSIFLLSGYSQGISSSATSLTSRSLPPLMGNLRQPLEH